MRAFLATLLLLPLALAFAPSASATSCEPSGGEMDCEAGVLGYASVEFYADFRTTDIHGHYGWCLDTHSHPGYDDCETTSWVLA